MVKNFKYDDYFTPLFTMDLNRTEYHVNFALNNILSRMYHAGITDSDFDDCWITDIPELRLITAIASLQADIKKASRSNEQSDIVERIYDDVRLDLLRIHNSPFLPIAEIAYCAQCLGWKITPIKTSDYNIITPQLKPLERIVVERFNAETAPTDERLITLPVYREVVKIELCDFLPRIILDKKGKRLFVGELATFLERTSGLEENIQRGLFAALLDAGKQPTCEFLRDSSQYFSFIEGYAKELDFIKYVEKCLNDS